ncbi:MAG: GNAT superfamily N-acetyltransferase [Neolewinella sp.]|jgi:GNAT superfamily N-acetyltransferase
MTIRSARLTDFAHLETFVWQAIFPAFDQPGLTDAQRAENDALVENARNEVAGALGEAHFGVFIALDSKTRSLAGYIIADARPRAYAEIKRLIVKRQHWGKGVGELLLEEATEFIGRDRAVSLAVRHYNERAIAFFIKYDFENTGETTGDHAISRTLMLREANEETTPPAKITNQLEPESDGFDFPSAADEPVFEALPDYTLATDEAPLFATGDNALRSIDPEELEQEETFLDEEQLSVLEAFIAKARAQKTNRKPEARSIKPQKAAAPAAKFDKASIAFEVDYGNGVVEEPAPPKKKSSKVNSEATNTGAIATNNAASKPSFSFEFTPVREETPLETVLLPEETVVEITVTAPPTPEEVKETFVPVEEPVTELLRPVAKKKKTKACPDCETKLPEAARFCFVCGHPQPEEGDDSPEQEELETLELTELSDGGNPVVDESVVTASKEPTIPKTEKTPREPIGKTTKPVTVSELRAAFKNHLQDRVLAYFGDRSLKKYIVRLEENTAFQQVRDGSLTSLAGWLNDQPAEDLARVRRQNTFADLTEYFIAETAGDLSNNILPQRLLRHQSVNWKTADIFRLVMDYLDFETESESVHTDFVTMPARALKNATKSFLHAAKDERVFFICDQSLISRAKNGFAVTDAGIYWKNVLQPAGAATFTTMRQPRMEQGHVILDGQFFDAGGRLNLKVAILMDKLRRMR